MLFEVFIPARDSDGYDETLTVDADNWMIALKSGLQRTGEEEMDMRSVMCDIKQDNSIHITDAYTRRVFVLRELDAEDDEETVALRKSNEQAAARAAVLAMEQRAAALQSPIATPGLEPAINDPAPTIPPGEISPADVEALEEVGVEPVIELVDEAPAEAAPHAAKKVEVAPQEAPADVPLEEVLFDKKGSSDDDPIMRSGPVKLTDEHGRPRIGSSEYRAQSRDQDVGRIVSEVRKKTGQRPAVTLDRDEHPSSVSENILEDIFLEIQIIHESDMTMEDAVNFVMDLAMEKVPAESGAVLFADVTGKDLYFATARGPKAQEVMDFRVPMGQGLAGFCAHEGITISISDAPSDPRFFKQISDALSYPTTSIACAPIQFEGRVYGCIELINRKSGNSFNSNEANALTYIGNQFAQYVNRLIMSREKI